MERSKRRHVGIVFVVSGPSGSGKTTLAGAMMEDPWMKRHLRKSVSLTTRPKRSGEREGRDYFFVTPEQFTRLRRVKKILEWTRYLGYYYATPKEAVDAQRNRGKHLIMCLDLRGARRIKKLYPTDSVSIFVMPPSVEILQERIRRRCGRTSDEEIKRRLSLARTEMLCAGRLDYCVLNADLSAGVRSLKIIIIATIKERGGR